MASSYFLLLFKSTLLVTMDGTCGWYIQYLVGIQQEGWRQTSAPTLVLSMLRRLVPFDWQCGWQSESLPGGNNRLNWAASISLLTSYQGWDLPGPTTGTNKWISNSIECSAIMQMLLGCRKYNHLSRGRDIQQTNQIRFCHACCWHYPSLIWFYRVIHDSLSQLL